MLILCYGLIGILKFRTPTKFMKHFLLFLATELSIESFIMALSKNYSISKKTTIQTSNIFNKIPKNICIFLNKKKIFFSLNLNYNYQL